ncbi:MAG: DUF2383 domain-containing protein [Bacteroidota bacterium]
MPPEKNTNGLGKLLHALIKINNRRIENYYRARDRIKDNTHLKIVFMERIKQSANFILDLKEYLSGSTDKNSRNILPSASSLKKWISTTSFSKSENASILDKCEMEEESVIKVYELTLQSKAEIPGELRFKITQQQQEIRSSYEFIKKFRDFNLDLSS